MRNGTTRRQRRASAVPRILIASVVAVTMLVGCSERQEGPLTVWSNDPDTAFFVERYNLDAEEPIHLRYVENLSEALTQERAGADVVIGRWVNTPTVNRLMLPVAEHVVPRERPSDPADADPRRRGVAIPESFSGISTAWVPLAYTLPAVVYATDRTYLAEPFAVSFPDLVDATEGPITAGDPPPPVFAPAADTAGIYAVYRSLGFETTTTAEGAPTWRQEDLERSIGIVTDWTTDHFGSPEAEQSYIEEFLYDPPLRLLETGRIALVYRNSASLFTWSFFEDHRFDFRWLATPEGPIRINEDIVYVGIPANSSRRDEAVDFVQWITAPSVQVELIRQKSEAGIDTFGFFGGFSTIPEVNTEIAATLYPRLADRVPAPGILLPPKVHPRYWNEAIHQIVAPFLLDPSDAAAPRTLPLSTPLP
ncbi:MAG: hypothetical protein ACLFR8_09705, partial [Alkalispirochaeta sp.]